ncbi:MAG TPA: VWA domain-containing protein [Acidobacteriota bacterium]|nr:VWA domain-containing protein [Acidobacteriota bacterium]
MKSKPDRSKRVAGSFLLPNLLLFARLLRKAGLRVTSRQNVELVEALRWIDWKDRASFRAALLSTLVHRRQDLDLFDALFELFWSGSRRWDEQPLELGRMLQRSLHRIESRGASDIYSGLAGASQAENLRPLPGFSAVDRLRQKDFAQLSESEREEVVRFIRSMSWQPGRRRMRRLASARRGRPLDLRRTLRASLKMGAEPARLFRRQRKWKRRRLIVLCDISGSMEPYSRILLEFLYSLDRGLHTVESFAFGSRLSRLTPLLKDRSPGRALRRAAASIPDFGGGTRIGESLRVFNREWARRVLTSHDWALIISDGWDRGEPERIRREIARLQRSCFRLVWLNPLLGAAGFQPLTRGLKAALPHVDHFLPVHNLVSLEELGRRLGALAPRGGRSEEQLRI